MLLRQGKMRKIITICLSCFLIVSCETTKTVDTYCAATERGTIHVDDTPKTQRWMWRYETLRQKKCPVKTGQVLKRG